MKSFLWRIFEKPKILGRDVFETSLRGHGKDIFLEMCSRRLKDTTQKTSFLRYLKDVTKKTSFLRYFWEVCEISLSMEIWLRSLRNISCRLGNVIAALYFKVACRVQIWKKHFVKIVKSLVTVLFEMTLFLCIYFAFTKNPIILSPFEIDTLNFAMYISTILTCPLKSYVIGLHNLISMNIFFTAKYHSSQFFFIK